MTARGSPRGGAGARHRPDRRESHRFRMHAFPVHEAVVGARQEVPTSVTRRLDPDAIAKAVGGRKVCRTCTPFERLRFMGQRDSARHPRCDDLECGCCCQDTGRAS